jgi:hypothetical protein
METAMLNFVEEEGRPVVLRCAGCGAPLGAQSEAEAEARAVELGWVKLGVASADDPNQRWYCATSKPRDEAQLAASLRRLGR